MKNVNQCGLMYRLFLFFVLCSSFLLQAPDTAVQPNFVTYSVDSKNDGASGTCGWKPLQRSSRSFSLTFKAIKGWDLFITLKNDTSTLDIVIGGWGNRNSGISLEENKISVGSFWLCSDQNPVAGATIMPGCTSIVPDVTNPVEYTMTITQGLKEGEGYCRVTGKKQDGTIVKIIEISHQWFNRTFNAYSFKAWNGPVKIADDVATVLDTPVRLKVATTNKYVDGSGAGVLQATDKKPDSISFVVTSSAADASKKTLFCRANSKYVSLRNLQQLDSDNLGSATKDSSKISAEETVVDPASFGRVFTFEAEGSGFKIKNSTGAITTYLRVDDDGYLRAFKADPTKNNKYIIPITKAEATLFASEEAPLAPAFNAGDVIAFKFADGSFLGLSSPSSTRRLIFNSNGIMDPVTHFKIFNYPDSWKEAGIITFATGDYDIASYQEAVYKSVPQDGPAVLGLDLIPAAVQSDGPWAIWLKSDPNITRFKVFYDSTLDPLKQYSLGIDSTQAIRSLPSTAQLPAGFFDKKLCKNADTTYPIVFKKIDASTPITDYSFSIVLLKPHQRALEGLKQPINLDSVGVDLETRFKPFFLAGSMAEDDWKSFFIVFNKYIRAASSIDGFTAPQGTPAASVRDKIVALITSAFAVMPQSVKAMFQDLQNFLIDIPTSLLNPATPPTLFSGIKKYDRMAFKVADGLFLGSDSTGKLAALNTSIFDERVHFIVTPNDKDVFYDQANGKICLSQTRRDSPGSVFLSPNYLRMYQAADQTLSFGLTQTQRFIEMVVNQAPSGSVAFAYGGLVGNFSAASLGLSSGGAVRNFTPLSLTRGEAAFDNYNLMLQVDSASANQRLDRELSYRLHLWGSVFSRNATGFVDADWNFYTKCYGEFLAIASTAQAWNETAANKVEVPPPPFSNVTPAGFDVKTNADLALGVLLFMQSHEKITSIARDNLAKTTLLFSPLKAGLKMVLKGDSGSLLMREMVDSKSVLKMSGTSTYNPNTRFEVAEFNPSTGMVVLKNSEGLYLAVDAASKDLVFTANRAEFTVMYDPTSKKVKLNFAGKSAQIDPVSKNVKMTADISAGLLFVVQSLVTTDSPLFASIATDPLDVAIEQKLKPLFTTTTGKTPDDWQYFLSVLSSYIQTKLVTPDDYVTWGTRRADLSNISLKEDVIAFLTSLITALTEQIQAAQSPTKEALQQVVSQCTQIITQLQDVPVYVNRTILLKPITGFAAQNTIALKVGDGSFLVPDNTGGLKAAKTVPLDPATQILVTAYDQQKGRAIFKIGEKYLDISPAAPYGFVLKNTPRYVDLLGDANIATRFSFVVAGTKVSIDSSKLGPLTTSPVDSFDVIGALSDDQKSFKKVLEGMATAPTIKSVQDDIATCFDKIFPQLGVFDGDWLYFVQKFDAYLQFVSATIRLDSVQLSGVRGGTLTLKDYANRLLTAISGQYSSAPQDAQNAAKKTQQWLSSGAMPSGTPAETSAVLAADTAVFMQTIAQDAVTKQKLAWTGDALVLAPQLHDIDRSMHFKVLAYDAAAKSVVFGNGSLVFDPTVGKFVTKQIKDVQPLLMQSVSVAGSTYYYLKNAAGAQLAIAASGGTFGPNGDLFDFTKIADKFLQIDALADPAAPADFERGLVTFVAAFDLVAGDASGLSYVLNVFDAYCTKAAAFPSWSTEKTTAGPIFKEYARLLLTVTRNAMSDSMAALKTRIADLLANGPAFAQSVVPVANQPTPTDQTTSTSPAVAAQPAYAKLDGATGALSADLTIFDAAFTQAREDSAEITNILNAFNSYLGEATKRFDWYAQGTVFGGAIPQNDSIKLLQGILDKDWFYSGLTDDLKQRIVTYITNSKNNAASYQAQIAKLDVFAKAITKADGLTASSQLVQLLKSFITELLGIGIPPQLRAQVLKKIDMYFDGSMVPALQLAKIDPQKNSWNLLLFGLELQLLSGDVSSLELLDEKVDAFEQVVIPRLKILDPAVQIDAMANYFDLVKKVSAALKQLVPDTKSARFTRFVAVVFTYVDYILKLNAQDDDFSVEQKSVITGLQNLSQQIKIDLGAAQAQQVAPVIVGHPVNTGTPTVSQTQGATITPVTTPQAQSGQNQQMQSAATSNAPTQTNNANNSTTSLLGGGLHTLEI